MAAVQKADGTLSISQAAKLFDVSKSTLSDKLQSCRDQVLYGHTKQRLTHGKKTFFGALDIIVTSLRLAF